MPDDTGTRFRGRTVLVTGASRGIGRACAQVFAGEGARVAVHYHRDSQAADDTLTSLQGSGHATFSAALGEPVAVESLVNQVNERMGPVDVLVNNAGIFLHTPVLDLDFAKWQCDWNETLALNLSGAAHLCFLIARQMIDRGAAGRIVNVSSRGAYRGEPEAPAYGASKAGLNALSQSLAQALGPHGIFVFAVAPGFVETDMTKDMLSGREGDAIRGQSPLNRAARPEEIAHTVAFLAAEGSEFLTGAVVDANGASYLR
jgi:3-oxoacyl-[acyl-carrier protein] reductase